MYYQLAILAAVLGNVMGMNHHLIRKDITIALRQSNLDDLKAIFESVSDPWSNGYSMYWTREEILKLISPPEEEKKPLYDWLGSHNILCQDLGDAYQCYGDEETINEVFNVVDEDFFYQIPEQFEEIIEFVEGIFDTKIPELPRVNITVPVWQGADTGYVTREVLQRVFGVSNETVVNVSAAAIEYQDQCGFSQTDLETSQRENGEHVHNISHTVGPNYGADTESELDVQMISQVVDGVDLWYWQGTNWLYSLAVNFFNASSIPEVISMSWGWAEDSQCGIVSCSGNMTSEVYVSRVNTEYMKIGLRGTTIVVASGDAGAPGRTSEMCEVSRPVNPVFPGSSPYVTSVGATYLLQGNSTPHWTTPICQNNHCATGTQQAVVNFNTMGWTSGGGFGIYNEGTPKWQYEEVSSYLASGVSFPSNFNKQGRAYPDVAMTGHNCATYQGGMLGGVDGTSCSAPTFAGVITLLNYHQKQQGKPILGFANPVLYRMSRTSNTAFTDITTGNNTCTEYMCCGNGYGYHATEGFDAVTGLGTPNIQSMTEWMDLYL